MPAGGVGEQGLRTAADLTTTPGPELRVSEPMGELLLLLYSRPGCHLCEVAKKALALIVARYGLRIEERNVERDPRWERDYGTQIPVGVLAGRKVFKYRLDPERIERTIQAQLQAAQRS